MTNLEGDDNYVVYGTALDPIEEEEVARKKPITIAEQIATDDQGRRRFHGAFTGGFSAGYFNTVGSKEGWTPATFKSSREERFSSKGQNVTDFMDDEDIGAFGIAPQVLRPTKDFTSTESQTTSRKRPKPVQSDGPIPGVPVLEQIIKPVRETVGIRILMRMGWRHGQGVGPRVSKKKKEKSKKQIVKDAKSEDIDRPDVIDESFPTEAIDSMNDKQSKKTYGCQLPPQFTKKGLGDSEEDSSEDEIDTDVLFAPDDVESPLCNPKVNSFGLGYKGLERMTSSGHIDLFGNSLKFRVDNKKMNITGEAFGIGAFEEPDEDVYSREDLSQYDFELETIEERRSKKVKEALDKAKKKQTDSRCIAGFRLSKSSGMRRKFFPPPHLPHDFQPVHVVRKSRFETSTSGSDDPSAKRGLGRHALTVQERQVLIGEENSDSKRTENLLVSEPSTQDATNSKPKPSENQSPSVPVEKDPSIMERVERIKKFVQVLQAHSSAKLEEPLAPNAKPAFQPFIKNPEKQDRYEKYLTLVSAGFQESLKDLQPLEMTEWEREREKQEFERASAIYKPLSGVMSSRFISAKSHDISHIVPDKEVIKEKDPTEDPKVAARLNLFGKLTHAVVEWHPDKLLCKRFNIKDPYPDSKFVGLRGVPSSCTRTENTAASIDELQSVKIASETQPKKSLFENLDFSKPPPGLPPLQQPTETLPPGIILEAESVKGKENIHPVKPPLDLFKEIFADSSSESEDELQTKVKDTERVRSDKDKSSDRKEAESSDRMKDKHNDRDDLRKDLPPYGNKGLDEGSKGRSSDEKHSGMEKRRIFDNLDLSKVNSRERPSTNNRNDNDEEDDDQLYGPRAPAKPLSNSYTNSKHCEMKTSDKPTFIPRTSTAITASSLVKDGEVVWVEKEAISRSRTKTKKHSIKKHKSKKSKSKHKPKHKKSKKRKSKKSKSSKSKNANSSSSSSSSDDEDERQKKKDNYSSDDSSSSININSSLDQKALLAQLKHITRSH